MSEKQESTGDQTPRMTRFLGWCRLILFVPVFGCIVLTAAVVMMGVGRMWTAAQAQFEAGWDFSAKASKAMSLAVIEIIDLFLVGTVSYITAVGLYKLFIAGTEIRLPVRLQISNLKDLEDKIIGVIVAALAVAFLGRAAAADRPEALLNYGGGIALVIAALAFFMAYAGKSKSAKE